jgi:hypothetical protein
MESIYYNEAGKYDGNHGWNRIYKKSEKIYHETYKYKKLEDIDSIVENYVKKGYVLERVYKINNLVILRKEDSTVYLWPKSNDLEEIEIKRLY